MNVSMDRESNKYPSMTLVELEALG